MFNWGYSFGDWFWGLFGVSWEELDDGQTDWREHTVNENGGGSW